VHATYVYTSKRVIVTDIVDDLSLDSDEMMIMISD